MCRLWEWWRAHRPAGGVIRTVRRDMHRDPTVRPQGIR